MKAKKVLFLFMLVLFLSACSAKYNLEFKNNKIIEETTISQIPSDSFQLYKDYYILAFIPTDNVGDRDMSIKEPGEIYYNNNHSDINYSLSYNYKFNVKNYNRAYFPLVGNQYFNFLTNDNSYTISTGEEYKVFKEYPNLDYIDVYIKTNHKLIETNADSIDGYNYYWRINKGEEKSIYLELDKNKYVFNYENEFTITMIIIGSIIIIGIGISFHLFKKMKKLNEV